MNKELLEKLEAIRKDLVAFQANVTDAEKLANLVRQKLALGGEVPAMWRNYWKLYPYMTVEQTAKIVWLYAIRVSVDDKSGRNVVDTVTKLVPPMLADLDVIALKLKQPLNLSTSG